MECEQVGIAGEYRIRGSIYRELQKLVVLRIATGAHGAQNADNFRDIADLKQKPCRSSTET